MLHLLRHNKPFPTQEFGSGVANVMLKDSATIDIIRGIVVLQTIIPWTQIYAAYPEVNKYVTLYIWNNGATQPWQPFNPPLGCSKSRTISDGATTSHCSRLVCSRIDVLDSKKLSTKLTPNNHH